MTSTEEQLWNAIKEYKIDAPEASFSFTDRLARENCWDIGFATRVVHEYKKFIFLICTSNNPMTPSEEVDQAWHLHLIYTHSYWVDFCENLLQRKIHHGPTAGGRAEQDKFIDWYEQTKEYYLEKFGYRPPEDIWPPSSKRFSPTEFIRIDKKKFWLIRKFNF